jgi:hypothetical protein
VRGWLRMLVDSCSHSGFVGAFIAEVSRLSHREQSHGQASGEVRLYRESPGRQQVPGIDEQVRACTLVDDTILI